MKRLLLVAFTTLSINAVAQTNTFPTSGNVGIGTTNPQTSLDVNGNIRASYSGTDIGGCITIANPAKTANGQASSWCIYNMSGGYNNSLQFWAYDNIGCTSGGLCNNRFTLMDNGNVGVGTTSPQYKLDINGDARIGSNLLLGNWQLNNNSWPGSGGFTYGGDDVIFGLHSNGGQASLQIDGAFIQAEAGKINTYAGISQFNNTINFPGSGIWNTSGNVGIGNTNPQSPLHIKASTGYGSVRISPISDNAESSMGFFLDANGTSNSTAWVIGNSAWGNTGKFIIGNQTAGGPIITAQQNGNVGIGTTNPAGKLDLFDSNQHLTFLLNQKLTGNWPGTTEATTMTIQSSGSSAGNLAFATGNSEVMRITASSNVGIGTANPDYKLDVLGTIRAKEVLVNLDGGADFVFEKDYKLLPIEHVASYVRINKHLPDVPPANEMVKNGVSMGDLQIKLLQKVEELTLYAIQQNKNIESLMKRIDELESK